MMVKNQFTIGLFDKDTEQQEVNTPRSKKLDSGNFNWKVWNFRLHYD